MLDQADSLADCTTYDIVERSDQHADLTLLLENLVIPRLVAESTTCNACDRSARVEVPVGPTYLPFAEADVNELAHLSVSEDAQTLLLFVEQFLRSGHSVESIYIGLLAPAARALGDEWERDNNDFIGVTMGLWRIQEVLRDLALRWPPAIRPGHCARSALFSAMPGDQHSLGTLMIAEIFERAGWHADALIEPSRAEFTGKFASQHYDLIGLTVSCDCPSATLAEVVTTIRTVSRNRHVKVLLGGRAINEQPELVEICGADGTSRDARAAVALADQLVPVAAVSRDRLT